jgi:cell division protein ZapE
MLDVHARIHAHRLKLKRGEITGDDPIAPVAAALAEEAWLLCFDEFHVNDIADAMILGRLFARLFAHGVVVVATSNVAPEELYKDGLNRSLFLPFISLLREYMEVMQVKARTDFRLEKLAGFPVWHVPADAAADTALEAAWRRLTGGHPSMAQDIVVKGRVLRVPAAAMGVARFSFPDLCARPLAAADYLRLAHEFHTILIDRIPVMHARQRDEAKRFIILIDALYENAVKLLASAAAEPDALYQAREGIEAHEFRRTASRLIEMRSQPYLALPHGARAGAARSTNGIVET